MCRCSPSVHAGQRSAGIPGSPLLSPELDWEEGRARVGSHDRALSFPRCPNLFGSYFLTSLLLFFFRSLRARKRFNVQREWSSSSRLALDGRANAHICQNIRLRLPQSLASTFPFPSYLLCPHQILLLMYQSSLLTKNVKLHYFSLYSHASNFCFNAKHLI